MIVAAAVAAAQWEGHRGSGQSRDGGHGQDSVSPHCESALQGANHVLNAPTTASSNQLLLRCFYSPADSSHSCRGHNAGNAANQHAGNKAGR